MLGPKVQRLLWIGMTASPLLVGCASRERAVVNFAYAVEPAKGLPPGMETIAVMPAKVGETTDPKWSEISVTILQSLSRNADKTVILVTHDPKAAAFGSRTIHLEKGELVS